MNAIRKGFLLFNTVRYLRLRQLVNQATFRIKPKEQFWKYAKNRIEYKEFNLWIDGLDNEPVFMNRFKPDEMLSNKLTILNETRDFNSWKFSDASHLWNFNVHYLEYLVPLYSLWKSTGDDKYKQKINDVLNDWYEKGSFEHDSNQAYTISLRIVNQLIVAEAVGDKQKLYESIYAQYRYLLHHQEKHLLGNHYLENLKAIVISSVLFNDEDVYNIYIKMLLSELDEEVTEDGLHFERSLMYHKIVLEDLIRLALVLKQAEKSEYKNVINIISKMAIALYSLEYGIDRTPLFNDAGDNVAKSKDSLLNTCREQFDIKPEKIDSIAGYYKLYDGKTTVIFDCGELSPSYMPGHGQNDCLSYELFYDGKPVLVNSGTYQYQGDRRKYFRSTASHNTVVINCHEQSELWGEHRAGRRIWGVRSKTDENKNEIIGSCNNFYGENHTRRIRLKNSEFEVLDTTTGDSKSYLHMAPGLYYESGNVVGANVKLSINPINCEVYTQRLPYADCFGKIEETECLVFSWANDNEKHGYRIKIEEI